MHSQYRDPQGLPPGKNDRGPGTCFLASAKIFYPRFRDVIAGEVAAFLSELNLLQRSFPHCVISDAKLLSFPSWPPPVSQGSDCQLVIGLSLTFVARHNVYASDSRRRKI